MRPLCPRSLWLHQHFEKNKRNWRKKKNTIKLRLDVVRNRLLTLLWSICVKVTRVSQFKEWLGACNKKNKVKKKREPKSPAGSFISCNTIKEIIFLPLYCSFSPILGGRRLNSLSSFLFHFPASSQPPASLHDTLGFHLLGPRFIPLNVGPSK